MFGVAIASIFSKKVKKMWYGERQTIKILQEKVNPSDQYIWFHAASLGEFEQGRPLIERVRSEHPEYTRRTRTPYTWPSASEQKRSSIFRTSKKCTATIPKKIRTRNLWTIFCGKTFCRWSAKNGCPGKTAPSIRSRAKKPKKPAFPLYARAEKI